MHGMTGTGLGTREPHFSLVLGGEAALTLCSNHALFHALLLFLQVGLRVFSILGHAADLGSGVHNVVWLGPKWFRIEQVFPGCRQACRAEHVDCEGPCMPAASGQLASAPLRRACMPAPAERKAGGRRRGWRPQPGVLKAVCGAEAGGAAAHHVHRALVWPVVVACARAPSWLQWRMCLAAWMAI